MPQATDITINAAGYMIEPGTYKRLQDGMAEGRTERIAITDFFGGQRRALQLERDKFAASLNIGPALDGQGVEPWALSVARAAIAVPVGDALPVGGTSIPYQVVEAQGRVYFAIGKTLYFRTYGSGASGTVPVKSYPNTITDICLYAYDGLLLCFGSAADILYRNSAGAEVALLAGERGHKIHEYAGYAVWSDARVGSRPTVIRMVHGGGVETRRIDYEPIKMVAIEGELIIVTKQALYRFSGRVRDVMVNNPAYVVGGAQPAQIPGQEWSGDFNPFFQQGVHTERDDFRFVLGFGGRTLAWISGGVQEFTPNGDRAGWRSTGLNGLQCYGACVAAGYLVVAMLSNAMDMELWAYDGNGWWRFGHADYAASGNWNNPIPIAGGSGDHDITVFHHNTANVTTYRLAHRSGGLTAYATDATFDTPLIDAGSRDKPKAWRKIGAVFAAPETNGITSADVTAV